MTHTADNDTTTYDVEVNENGRWVVKCAGLASLATAERHLLGTTARPKRIVERRVIPPGVTDTTEGES